MSGWRPRSRDGGRPLTTLARLFESSQSAAEYATGYFERVIELIRQLDADAIARAIAKVEEASLRGKTIFCIGNGGSAAVTSHFVNDLSANSLVSGQPGIRSFSLADNVESITAIANDAGFENVFAYQLQASMSEGDVLIALSVSGNSENVIRGVEYANTHGGYTIGWCGFGGGRLARMCQLTIHVPTTLDEYGPVEAVFAHLSHVVSGYLTMKRGRKLSH